MTTPGTRKREQTEAVRGAVPLTDESLFEEVCKDQKEIVEAIEKLD